MSLFDSASLVVTPNGYKEGKLYSIKPTDGSGDLVVTRATTATRVNSSGLVELVPYNLISYSQEIDNAAWFKGGSGTVTANNVAAPDGTLTADRLNSAGDSSFGQSFTLASGQTYTFSVWLKAGTVSSLRIYSTLNSSAPNTLCSLTSEWQRFSLTFTVNQNGNVQIGGGGSFSSGNIYAWGGQLVAGSLSKEYQKTETRLNIPRLDYTNSSCPSILVEPQRTNLLSYSEQLDNSVWGAPSNVIANATISPSGLQDADNLIGLLARNVSLSNTTYTLSFYAKKNTSSAFTMRIDIGGIKRATYNFDTQTSVNDGISSSITPFGNGWFLCTFTFASPLSATAAFYPNESSANLYVWGMQLEAGSYATSYIPTVASTVTRNADVISKTGISSLIGQTEGTLFAEFKALGSYDSNNMILALSDGTASNRIFLNLTSNVGHLEAVITSSGSSTVAYEGSTPAIGYHKVALAYKNNDVVVYIDGALVHTDTSATIPATSKLNVGSYVDGTIQFNSGIKSAALWKTRISNAELASLTTL